MNKLNYEYNKTNTKSTILFLHGWGLSGNSFDGIIKCFGNVSYIKVDLFGFGNSEEPKEYFDAYEYAYQIFLLLKELKVENIIIVGHSFGGRLGIILSSVFNLNIEGLVLTSSAGLNKFSVLKWLKVKIYKIIKRLVKLKILSDKSLKIFGSRDYKNANISMRKILNNVVVQDLGYLLKFIACKTYLVWDKKDKDTPYWICKKLNKKIKDSRKFIYNYGGHFVAFKNVNKFSNLLVGVVKW